MGLILFSISRLISTYTIVLDYQGDAPDTLIIKKSRGRRRIRRDHGGMNSNEVEKCSNMPEIVSNTSYKVAETSYNALIQENKSNI